MPRKGEIITAAEGNREDARRLNDQMLRWRERVEFTETELEMLKRHAGLPQLTDDLNLLEIIRIDTMTDELAMQIIGRLSVYHREYHNWLTAYNALPSERDKMNLKVVRNLVAQRKNVIDAVSRYLNKFRKKERTRRIAEVLKKGQETGDVATFLLKQMYDMTIDFRRQGLLSSLNDDQWAILDAIELVLIELGLHTRTYGRDAKGEEETN